MGNIRKLIRHHNPELHVHGHWHYRYTTGITVGLAANINSFNDALYLWDRK